MTTDATPKDLRIAGRYVRATDPDMVARLKSEGEPTDLLSLGRLLYESDPDTFDRITTDRLVVL